jgi:hypothetical protein
MVASDPLPINLRRAPEFVDLGSVPPIANRTSESVMGRRDYAILMMLAKLGLRADEVAMRPYHSAVDAGVFEVRHWTPH